jgi:MerR family transcriptional regulator, light-induced transcriptional regulator
VTRLDTKHQDKHPCESDDAALARVYNAARLEHRPGASDSTKAVPGALGAKLPRSPSRSGPTHRECTPEPVSWPSAAGESHGPSTSLKTAKQRVGHLAHTLETELIPRLVRQHRAAETKDIGTSVQAAEVQLMVRALIDDEHARIDALVHQLRQRGVLVATIFLELLTPAARELGVLWEQDRVDFATVTVGLGRLQRLLRQLSPDFGTEVQHPRHGRRVLLTQPDSEQHMFGLSMVAEFFRRDGWDVLGGVAGVGIDATAWSKRDWFDVVGFSIGSELGLPWLRDTIAAVRRVSRNPALVVLVGGPIFSLHPQWAADVGADATTDGRSAPAIAETIVVSRVHEQSGRARMS